MPEKRGFNPDEIREAEQEEPSNEIVETETSVSYLGVKLEKAKDSTSQFVPKKEQYADFINDQWFSLPLQRDIAISFDSGDPMLLEGGTSLGKTTTVKKMCADLGYEVHYANLNGATDVEDLMGRYIPNPNKNKPEDPEYIFADGRVTAGLRQEVGKVKVIILDEINAAAPNILIRLHEVLDALERGGDVTLSEDASEVVKVDKQKTKIISTMNPPGKGYFGREPLDPAQLRRWVYNKLPSELPKETFSFSVDKIFEQLQELPGIEEIRERFKEFHHAAKELLKSRKIAEDQPQAFSYDDRMDPRRVSDFTKRFYKGDINETFQQGLRYYYANKLETEADRKKMEELIRMVEYKQEAGDSKRKGLERKPSGPEGHPEKKGEKKTELGQARARADKALESLFKNPNIPDEIRAELEGKIESSLQEQYKQQVEILGKYGLIEATESGGWAIKGIDGKEYPMPTQEEIARKIEENKELVERKREQGFVRLLIVPFGLKLSDLTEIYKKSILEHKAEGKLFGAKKDPSDQNEELVPLDLDENQPVWVWDKYQDADVNGSLVYQPKELSEKHQGKTKQEILGEQGGWRIVLVEDMPNILRENTETKGGRTQIDVKGSSIKKYMKRGEDIPSPAEYLKALQQDSTYKGEDGMAPEDQLMYAITHLEETNQVIDDYQGNGSVSYQVGAYFPASGYVPGAYWDRDYRQAYLGGGDPGDRVDHCGLRSAVRIF